MINFEKLLRDYNISVARPGDENYREGWLNVQCPFCGDHSRHLGIHRSDGHSNCWRCGWHPTPETISKLIGISTSDARRLMKDYGGAVIGKVKEVKRAPRIKAHKLPSDTGPMKRHHKLYLKRRRFDPNKLEKQWGLLGTGPMSKLDKSYYKHRIVAPIHWDGEQVSFQARDITGKQKPKYMACPKDRELVEHQTILYGDQSSWEDFGIIVEGITDVWRLGKLAAGTFGIDFSHKQVRAIAKHFKKVVILYDDEPQAQRQAERLRAELAIRGVLAFIETIQGDPGGLRQKKADELVKKLVTLYNK